MCKLATMAGAIEDSTLVMELVMKEALAMHAHIILYNAWRHAHALSETVGDHYIPDILRRVGPA